MKVINDINIPTSWSEVRIGIYQELNSYDKTGLTPLEMFINDFAILCDVDPAMVEELPVNKIEELKEAIAFYRTAPTESDKRFKIDGVEYGVMPNFNKFTIGQWADVENRLQDMITNLHYILAIIFRPIVKSNVLFKDRYELEVYTSETLAERAELFKEKLSMDKVYQVLVFFCSIEKNFTRNLQSSLEEQVRRVRKNSGVKMKLPARLQLNVSGELGKRIFSGN